jgi:hypothetical protein
MNKAKDTLLGYKAAFTVRTLKCYQDITGKDLTSLDSDPQTLTDLARAAIITGEGKEPEGLEDHILDSDGTELFSLLQRFAFFRSLAENSGAPGDK